MQYADAIKVFENSHLPHLRQFLSFERRFEPIFDSFGSINFSRSCICSIGVRLCDVMLSTEQRLCFHVLFAELSSDKQY